MTVNELLKSLHFHEPSSRIFVLEGVLYRHTFDELAMVLRIFSPGTCWCKWLSNAPYHSGQTIYSYSYSYSGWPYIGSCHKQSLIEMFKNANLNDNIKTIPV